MSKQRNSLAIFTLLILCMISVVIAPVFSGTGTPAMEFTETDSDPFEFEEDFFPVNFGNDGIIHQLSLKIGAAYLHVQPASLARLFPPPRPFSS